MIDEQNGVTLRLRKDLKRVIRIARVWKERWYSLTWCKDKSSPCKI